MDKAITLRSVTDADAELVLRLNRENVEVLAPMDAEKLAFFRSIAELFLIAEIDGVPCGFLIALTENAEGYESENFRWFKAHYERFLYVDRIVIDKPYRYAGAGKTLYSRVFEHARESGIHIVTAEIDTIPYNAASLRFHAREGFREAGKQFVRGGSVQVSLQTREV